MSYLEKNLTADFSKYLRKYPNALPHTCALEFKLTKKKSLSLKRDLQPQQYPSLFKAQYLTLYHKISDFSPSLKPFDAFYLKEEKAYLAVCFYEPRKPKDIYFLSAGTLASLYLSSNSITKEQFKAFSDFVITI